jgi:hypothetical protein
MVHHCGCVKLNPNLVLVPAPKRTQIQFGKLTKEEKLDIVIGRYKKEGYKIISARDVGKRINLCSQSSANLLKRLDTVKYNGKEWEIL